MGILRAIMKIIRQIGSLAFVLGLFTTIFAGIPWHVITATDPEVPLWLQIAVFCLLGGILLVLLTLAVEQGMIKASAEAPPPAEAKTDAALLLMNSTEVPGHMRCSSAENR